MFTIGIEFGRGAPCKPSIRNFLMEAAPPPPGAQGGTRGPRPPLIRSCRTSLILYASRQSVPNPLKGDKTPFIFLLHVFLILNCEIQDTETTLELRATRN